MGGHVCILKELNRRGWALELLDENQQVSLGSVFCIAFDKRGLPRIIVPLL